MEGSTVSVHSREGCVMKCGAKCLNSSGCLPYSQEAQPNLCVLLYIHTTLQQDISYPKKTHCISQRNDTFYAQFPKLTTIRCKFSSVEGHHTKYCCYVTFNRIGHVAAKPAFGTPRLRCAQHSRVPQKQPRCAECQTRAT